MKAYWTSASKLEIIFFLFRYSVVLVESWTSSFQTRTSVPISHSMTSSKPGSHNSHWTDITWPNTGSISSSSGFPVHPSKGQIATYNLRQALAIQLQRDQIIRRLTRLIKCKEVAHSRKCSLLVHLSKWARTSPSSSRHQSRHLRLSPPLHRPIRRQEALARSKVTQQLQAMSLCHLLRHQITCKPNSSRRMSTLPICLPSYRQRQLISCLQQVPLTMVKHTSERTVATLMT